MRGLAKALQHVAPGGHAAVPVANHHDRPAENEVIAARTGQPEVDVAALNHAFERARSHLTRLWNEAGTPDPQRAAVAQRLQTVDVASATSIVFDEIQTVLNARDLQIKVEKAIEISQGFLYLLQELSDRYTTAKVDRVIRQGRSWGRSCLRCGVPRATSRPRSNCGRKPHPQRPLWAFGPLVLERRLELALRQRFENTVAISRASRRIAISMTRSRTEVEKASMWPEDRANTGCSDTRTFRARTKPASSPPSG